VEAMRCGVPVVCMEGYGYNYFVKRSKGSRAVPIRYRAQVVKDLAHAVDRVAQHLPEYSRGALEESEAFLPERKRELIEEIYKTIMEEIR
jgi:glycosyltransferase involved in cell wall biosynthesis